MNEYIAETVEDIFTNNGDDIVGLFTHGNSKEMKAVLPLLYEKGLLGKGQQAYKLLEGLFNRGGHTPPVYTRTIM